MRRDGSGRRAALVTGALAALLVSAGAAAAGPDPQRGVEERLMCYCGCSDLTVRVCTCGTADAIRADIAGKLADGKSPDAIVADYVERYGRQIESAPSKAGFDLLAWITPFAALLIAGTALVAVVRRWGRAPAVPLPAADPDTRPAAGDAASRAEDRRALERVRRELREGR